MTAADTVAIVTTGVGNIASVIAGFDRLGASTRFVETPEAVRDAGVLVLPGVGAFAAAMEKLRSHDLVAALQERVAAGRPTLAICLGLQLLGAGSAEAEGCAGLACAGATAVRFAAGLRVPHMGWNAVEAGADCALLQSGAAYFAHSYLWTDAPGGWAVATADHGGRFVAAVERGDVLACQFHPELSGGWGEELIRRWLIQGGVPC